MLHLVALVGSIVVSASALAPSGEAELADVTARIEHAVVVSDAERLEELELELDGQEPVHRYTRAYIHWRLSYAVGPDQPDYKAERSKHLKRAREILEALVEDEPELAEAHALLGSVIGGQITNMFKGMTLGPKSTRALDRAFDLEPENPRVLLQQGISAIFTPTMFGGGLDKAEAKLREAEKRFALQHSPVAWPSWGRVDVQAWLGQVLAKEGDIASARNAYERGLAMEPDHAWIRMVLLPQLDKDAR